MKKFQTSGKQDTVTLQKSFAPVIAARSDAAFMSLIAPYDRRPDEGWVIAMLTADESIYRSVANQFKNSEGHAVVWCRDQIGLIRKMMHARISLTIVDVKSCQDAGALLNWRKLHRFDHLPVLLINLDEQTAHWLQALTAVDDAAWGIVAPEIRARGTRLICMAHPSSEPEHLVVGRYALDLQRREARVNSTVADLTEREFTLAWVLFRHVGETVKRDVIAEVIWGQTLPTARRSLEQYIYRVRTKLDLNGRSGFTLRSVYGIGYRIEESTIVSE